MTGKADRSGKGDPGVIVDGDEQVLVAQTPHSLGVVAGDAMPDIGKLPSFLMSMCNKSPGASRSYL